LSRLSRLFSIAPVCALVASLACGGGRDAGSSSTPVTTSVSAQHGGTLASSIRAEPRTFNRYVDTRTITEMFTKLVHAKLVRVNRLTDDIEPSLAERWTASPDNLEYTITLRSGLAFSDGAPLTADDVLFSFQLVYDPRTNSPIAEALQVNHVPLQVSARDPRTIVIRLPSPFGPGLRILDNLPIYPKHTLEPAFKAGKFSETWGTATPPAELVGAGPFVLTEYRPGERLVFSKNAHYWRRDDRGQALPYLDRVVLDIVPDQDAELVRLQSGQLDTPYSEIRAADYLPLKRVAETGRIRIADLGPAIDIMGLWFNLKPKTKPDPRAAWMQHEDFRHAISLWVDRQAFADTVYFGAAVPTYSPVSPSNKSWFSPAANVGRHDQEKARALLKGLGLTDRNSDGMLEDGGNRPVRFTIQIPTGNTSMERGASFLKSELAKAGIAVDVVILELGTFIDQFLKNNYEAVYWFGTGQQSDTDPVINIDYWISSGAGHVWNLAEKTPATDWERQIDDLMRRQVATVDRGERKRLFDEVQRIFVQHEPVIFFAVPRYYIVLNSRVTNATPAPMAPPVLWNADIISVRQDAGR
jgi:peptide/nickel transport system substrate-binding protein